MRCVGDFRGWIEGMEGWNMWHQTTKKFNCQKVCGSSIDSSRTCFSIWPQFEAWPITKLSLNLTNDVTGSFSWWLHPFWGHMEGAHMSKARMRHPWMRHQLITGPYVRKCGLWAVLWRCSDVLKVFPYSLNTFHDLGLNWETYASQPSPPTDWA